MKQIITVTLDLGKDLPPYELLEGKYEALKHFFEDIAYPVESIHVDIQRIQEEITEMLNNS